MYACMGLDSPENCSEPFRVPLFALVLRMTARARVKFSVRILRPADHSDYLSSGGGSIVISDSLP